MRYPTLHQDWIIIGDADDRGVDSHVRGHGTCVASKAVGSINGVSKNSRLIPVKITYRLAAIQEALIKISNDIRRRRIEGRAVVVCSLGSKRQASRPIPRPYMVMVEQLKDLSITQKTAVVFSAGNKGQIPVNSYPAYLAETYPETMIVAGATTKRGFRTSFSQALEPSPGRFPSTVWAIGDGVACASRASRN